MGYYFELNYTLEHEAAAITVGLFREETERFGMVELFVDNGGILAVVSADEVGIEFQLRDLTAIAENAIEPHLPVDADLTDPWRILIIDGDLMAENVRAWDTKYAQDKWPDEPEDGVLASLP